MDYEFLKLDLYALRHSDVTFELPVKDTAGNLVNLSQLDAWGAIREYINSDKIIPASYATVTGKTGYVSMTLTASTPLPKDRYFYEIYLTDESMGSVTKKVLAGQILVE